MTSAQRRRTKWLHLSAGVQPMHCALCIACSMHHISSSFAISHLGLMAQGFIDYWTHLLTWGTRDFEYAERVSGGFRQPNLPSYIHSCNNILINCPW